MESNVLKEAGKINEKTPSSRLASFQKSNDVDTTLVLALIGRLLNVFRIWS